MTLRNVVNIKGDSGVNMRIINAVISTKTWTLISNSKLDVYRKHVYFKKNIITVHTLPEIIESAIIE